MEHGREWGTNRPVLFSLGTGPLGTPCSMPHLGAVRPLMDPHGPVVLLQGKLSSNSLVTLILL